MKEENETNNVNKNTKDISWSKEKRLKHIRIGILNIRSGPTGTVTDEYRRWDASIGHSLPEKNAATDQYPATATRMAGEHWYLHSLIVASFPVSFYIFSLLSRSSRSSRWLFIQLPVPPSRFHVMYIYLYNKLWQSIPNFCPPHDKLWPHS